MRGLALTLEAIVVTIVVLSAATTVAVFLLSHRTSSEDSTCELTRADAAQKIAAFNIVEYNDVNTTVDYLYKSLMRLYGTAGFTIEVYSVDSKKLYTFETPHSGNNMCTIRGAYIVSHIELGEDGKAATTHSLVVVTSRG